MNTEKSLIDIPVLLMLFNRPETTKRVFEKLREARPSKLFIAANGPRPGMASDMQSCQAVRDIFRSIDWECEVHTNYREINIGMQPHWRLAMDWFFEHVDAGIILEDDCVPDTSFLSFSKELLEKYKDNENVMHINGSNFQFGKKRGEASYYFSKYPSSWGWATWKRAWQRYNNTILDFPEFMKKNMLDTFVTSKKEKRFWMKMLSELASGKQDGCDTKWAYAIWSHDGICITPNVNMIRNIGFGSTAGHTILKDRSLDQDPLNIGKIIHPTQDLFAQNKGADAFTFKIIFHRNFFQKVKYVVAVKLVKILK